MQKCSVQSHHMRDHYVAAFLFELDVDFLPFRKVAASADQCVPGKAAKTSEFPLDQCLLGNIKDFFLELSHLWLNIVC